MVFCTPIISSLSLDNNTSINPNITLAGDEVGKIESIKFRDGTQCTIDDKDDDDFIQHTGMCITGQCQVSCLFWIKTNIGNILLEIRM